MSIPTLLHIADYYLLPFYFGDLGKGVSFVSDIAEVGGETILPMGPNIYLPALATVSLGALLLIYRIWRKEAIDIKFLFMLAVLGIFLILRWESKWHFRIMLMTFIPIGLLTGYILSLARDNLPQLLIAILIISYPISAAIPLADRLHPTITPVEYNELQNIREILSSQEALIIFGDHTGKRYRAEYILDRDLAKPGTPIDKSMDKAYLIIPNKLFPPPHIKIIYRGERYSLYSLYLR